VYAQNDCGLIAKKPENEENFYSSTDEKTQHSF
jgi:hypothetical protein